MGNKRVKMCQVCKVVFRPSHSNSHDERVSLKARREKIFPSFCLRVYAALEKDGTSAETYQVKKKMKCKRDLLEPNN